MPNQRTREESAPPEPFQYWAFISYSHHDAEWAKRLHTILEGYRTPRRLVGRKDVDGDPVPKRFFPIFRDLEELACAPNLSETIETALRQSKWLIVVCSPYSARSWWVDKEVQRFKSLGRQDRILCVIVAADETTAGGIIGSFPPSLIGSYNRALPTAIPMLPLAADVRGGRVRRRDAILRLVAGLMGVTVDELHRRHVQRQRIRYMSIVFITGILLAASGLPFLQLVKAKNAMELLKPRKPSQQLVTEQQLVRSDLDQLRWKEGFELSISTADTVQEVTLGSDGMFPLARTEMNPQGEMVVRTLSRIFLRDAKHLVAIQVIGHTDSVPLAPGMGRSNWDLGALRATTVVNLLQESGLDPSKITAVSTGAYQPISEQQSENRAVVIRLTYSDRASARLPTNERLYPK